MRRARPEDGPAFLGLVRELADYEKLPGPTSEDEARLLADAFAGRPRFELWVGEVGGVLAAYAVTFETYSTFSARPILYLEDLYVTPSARGTGLGRLTLRTLAAEAVRRGCVRLSWVVLDWNTDAQKFYERLGAKPSAGWLPYALEGEALRALAATTNQ